MPTTTLRARRKERARPGDSSDPRQPAGASTAPVRLVSLLLFGSGACALVYQAVWFRQLRLIFGASTQATAAVLAIFMGGICLGSLWLGRRAERHPNPLRLYGLLELGIAAGAAATPALVWLVDRAYVGLGGMHALGAFVSPIVQLVLATLVLGGPAVLMGGTLPAAARAVVPAADAPRRRIAAAYGINTLGAVTGTLLATFVLLERLGARGALWAAVCVNVAVGLTTLAVSRSARRAEPEPETASTGVTDEPRTHAAPSRRVVLGVAAAAGFVFFVMELVWYRMLGALLGGTSFTFGLVLAVALLGIGLGSAAYAWAMARRTPTLGLLGATCALEALALAAPFALGDRLAIAALLLRALGGAGFAWFVVGWALICGIVVLPAALVAGFQFPLLVGLLGRGRAHAGTDTGVLYAANTLGAIAGSLAGGFGLMAALTAPGVWRLAAGILSALALLLFGLDRRRDRRSIVTLASAVAALCWVSLATGPTAAWRHSGIGAGRHNPTEIGGPNNIATLLRYYRQAITWQADGRESSIGMSTSDGINLIVGGKSDGNAIGDAGTQVMLGLLGALVNPSPQRALVIGLGTGSSAGWLAAVPTMQRVDVIELEPRVVDVARACAAVNRDVLANPKVRIRFGDGRELLLTTRERYDVIASEPSNPYRAGVASLYTREFYHAARRRLAPGGVFVQWVQAYGITPAALRTVYASMGTAFPHIETWATLHNDMVLVASAEPFRIRLPELRERLGREPFQSAITSAWRVATLEGVLGHYVGGERLATQLGQGARENTDDNMTLEYAFARTVGHGVMTDTDDLVAFAASHGAARPDWADSTVDLATVVAERACVRAAEGTPPPEPARADARVEFLRAYVNEDYIDARRVLRAMQGRVTDITELAAIADVLADGGDSTAFRAIDALRAYRPGEAEFATARLWVRRGDMARAADAYVRACAICRETPWTWPLLASRSLPLAQSIAESNASPADVERVYQALATPFAAEAMNQLRQGLRVAIAVRLDGGTPRERTRAALDAYPGSTVPWQESILATRAACFGRLGDPRAREAARDLARFRAQAYPDLATSLQGPSP